MALLVKDLMSTHLVTIREDDPLTVLMELFNHAHVSGLPVVNAEGSVIGVVSKTDLTDHLVLQHIRQHQSLDDLKVKDLLLHHSPAVVHENDNVSDASQLMKRLRVHRVLVKNDAAQIVGILTTFDILKTFSGEYYSASLGSDTTHLSNALSTQSSEAKDHAGLLEVPLALPPHPLKVLSCRELQVLALIAEGKTNAEIQSILKLSDDWLHGYIQNIVVKLEVENEIQAVKRAVEEKIIEHAAVLETEMLI